LCPAYLFTPSLHSTSDVSSTDNLHTLLDNKVGERPQDLNVDEQPH